MFLQKSFLQRFVNGKCEEFFRYIFDKMTDAEAEIRATITVQTTESTAAKKSEKDASHCRAADGRRGTVIGGRRDTLVTGKRCKLLFIFSFVCFLFLFFVFLKTNYLQKIAQLWFKTAD